jgi:hypothetical protein
MNYNDAKRRCDMRTGRKIGAGPVIGLAGAENEWRKTLNQKQRAKLEIKISPWGRNGGSIVLPKRRTKTARRNETLRREREARFQAEQADYEARLAAPWKIEKSRAA